MRSVVLLSFLVVGGFAAGSEHWSVSHLHNGETNGRVIRFWNHDVHITDSLLSSGSSYEAEALNLPIFNAEHTQDQTSLLHQYLVHVKGPVTSATRQALSRCLKAHPHPIGSESDSRDLELGEYIPQYTFMVAAPATIESKAYLSKCPSVLYVTEFHPLFKIQPDLVALATYTHQSSFSPVLASANAEDEPLELTVNLMNQPCRGQMLQSGQQLCTERLLQQWTDLAKQHGVEGMQLRFSSDRRLHVKLDGSQQLHQAVSWLSSRREVHSIERRPTFEIQNKFAKFTIQSDVFNKTPIFDQRLTGANQTILLGDTGVDMDLCFFADPDQAIAHYPSPPNLKHRKIVWYNPIADAADDAEGHGTHVAGSLAGNAYSNSFLKDYNGMAPDAKLVIYDFKRVGQEDLLIPDNIGSEYFLPAYQQAHARLSSNSWGSEDGMYSSFALDADQFIYEHPDFLPVFAGGNYGSQGLYSISSPGVAKNVLTIGATLSSSESFFQSGQQAGFVVTAPATVAGEYQVAPSLFGTPFTENEFPQPLQLVLAEPYDACAPLTNGDALNGKAALVIRGGGDHCTFSLKAQFVQDTGALLMIVVDSKPEKLFTMGAANAGNITISTVLVSNENGVAISNAATADVDSPVFLLCPVEVEDARLNDHTVADFSSRGPTLDGRIKPDVLAPGQQIISARSDGDPNSGNCDRADLVPMQGTSMATPIGAGAAALVRQYFTDGFYPSGAANPEDARSPSAALIKAIIIASGAESGGSVESDDGSTNLVTAIPSYYQGFGRILLDAALSFNNTDDADLYLVDSPDVELSTSEYHQYCVLASPVNIRSPMCDHQALSDVKLSQCMRPFKATLVWTDPPGSVTSAIQLVNDLDLSVSMPAMNRLWMGNNHHYPDQNGYLHKAWDVLNNVEQVTLDIIPDVFDQGVDQYLSIRVRGTNVPKGPQAYSLVLNGNFRVVENSECLAAAIEGATENLMCPNGCSHHGVCTDSGLCDCAEGFFGADCASEAVPLQLAAGLGEFAPIKGQTASEGWSYFSFELNATQLYHSFRVLLQRTSTVGDPDVYVEVDRFPTLTHHNWSITVCESCGSISDLIIPVGEMKPGKYIIGVHGYCCDDSTYDLIVTNNYSDKVADTPSRWTYLGYGSLIIIGLLSIVAVVFWRIRKRHNNSAAVEVRYISNGEAAAQAGFQPISQPPA
jgi:subtilisin family serine protease